MVTYKRLDHISTKWSNFSYNIECPNPSCRDNEGHAGVFPHPLDASKDGYIVHCVKCGHRSYDAQEAARVTTYLKEHGQYISADDEGEDLVNYKWHHRTYTRVKALLGYAENAEARLNEALYARGYSDSLIAHLKTRGFGFYEPHTEPLYVFNLDPRAAGLRLTKWHGEVKAGQRRYRLANPQVKGILIPLYHGGYLTGFTIRNTGYGDARYMLLCHPRKDLSKTQQEARIVVKHTYIKSTEIDNVLYVCEGPIKAEVLSHYFKKDVLGALSLTSFADKNFKSILKKNKDKEIIVVPDADYKTNSSVAHNYWKLVDWMIANNFKCSFLEWKHPDKDLLESLKGIDDALVQNEADGLISFRSFPPEEFFFRMDRRARYGVIQKLTKGMKVKPGSIIDEETLKLFEGKIIKDDEPILSKPDQIYKVDERVDVMMQALAKHKLVVDTSPTGSGKSHAIGLFDIATLNTLFIDERVDNDPRFIDNNKQISMFDWHKPSEEKQAEYAEAIELNTVKKIKYISQSPINNTVSTLNRFNLVMGRNSTGWTYDVNLSKWRQAREDEPVIYEPNCPQASNIITLKKNKQIMSIQKDICAKCPLKDGCSYLSSVKIAKKSPYTRSSIQSLNVQKGDIVVLDDPGSIEFYSSMSLSKEDLDKFFDLLAGKKAWKAHLPAIQQLVLGIFGLVKDGRSLRSSVNELEVQGKLNYNLLTKWFQLTEPDLVSLQRLRMYNNGEMEIPGERYQEFKKVKRWFFTFLHLVADNQVGDMYFEAKTQQWVIKGVDPKFKDMYNKAAAILILDATANKEFFEEIFGVKPHIMSAEGDPYKNVKVTQVEGFHNTYASGSHFMEIRERAKEKIGYINQFVEENPSRPAGVITFKTLFDKELTEVWHPSLTKGYWFCDERASNAFYLNNVERLFLMGIPTPNIASIAAESKSDTDLTVAWVARKYGVPDANGKQQYMVVRDTADVRLRKVLWYKRASAYVQALGRLRSLQRPDETLELFILDSTPLPFTPSEIINMKPDERRQTLTLANDELAIKLRHFDHLINFITEVKETKGNAITMEVASHISSNINAAGLHKVGVSVKTCSSCDDILNALIVAKDNLKANPDLLYVKLVSEPEPIEPDKKLIELRAEGFLPSMVKSPKLSGIR